MANRYKHTTAKQVEGDDGYGWAVFVHGKQVVSGLTRGEVSHYREQLERKEEKRRAHNVDTVDRIKHSPKTKTKLNPFPRLKRGGYTAHFHFMDEYRGERYFDQEWGVHGDIGKFTITCECNYRGELKHDHPAGHTIGKSIKVGNAITVHPRAWNMRGAKNLPPVSIVVTGVEIDPEHGYVTVTY